MRQQSVHTKTGLDRNRKAIPDGRRWPNVLSATGILALILSFGATAESVWAQQVTVHPGNDIQALVSSHSPGTRFSITSGVYRLQSVKPKDGDSFIGESGAVLSGATVLDSYNHQNQYWVANVNVRQEGDYRGQCNQDRPACKFPQDLFIDDTPLQRVTSLSDVSAGKWYLDAGQGKAYFSDDPNGHKVEISLIPQAFYGVAKNVTIQGLTIEKYADVAGDGAIGGQAQGGHGKDWIVRDNLIQFNHGMGIRVSDGMQVLNNKILHNGQMGLGGSGEGVVIDGNEIAYNNYAGYNYGWEAGGSKFTHTTNLIVRNNYAHDNIGPGLWTDIENTNALYEHNRTNGNKEAGILHEISYHAVIRDNTIENDGFSASGKTAPWYGGGIVITASQDVEIYGNTVTDCMNGIVGLQANRTSATNNSAYLLRNLYVHDNIITQQAGIAAGIVKSGSIDNSIFTTWHNRFVNNTYHLASSNGKYFEWMNTPQTQSTWQGQGQGN